MVADYKKFQNAWAQIVAKTWSDAEFKQHVLENPEAVLKEHGIEIPAGCHVEIHVNTPTTYHLTMSEQPKEELNEETLKMVAAAGCCTFLGI